MFLIIGLAMLLVLAGIVIAVMVDNTAFNNIVVSIVTICYVVTAVLFTVGGFIRLIKEVI